MKSRMAKSKTADLFAARLTPDGAAPSGVQVGQKADSVFGAARLNPAPAARYAGRGRSKQLWYAVVFPELAKEHSTAALQRLCMHAQQFTSFVSIEPPNALLLEIKGSLQLFGPLERMHADIDACWRRLALPAGSATAPTTLAALWLARGRQPCALTAAADVSPLSIEDLGTLPGHLTGVAHCLYGLGC